MKLLYKAKLSYNKRYDLIVLCKCGSAYYKWAACANCFFKNRKQYKKCIYCPSWYAKRKNQATCGARNCQLKRNSVYMKLRRAVIFTAQPKLIVAPSGLNTYSRGWRASDWREDAKQEKLLKELENKISVKLNI